MGYDVMKAEFKTTDLENLLIEHYKLTYDIVLNYAKINVVKYKDGTNNVFVETGIEVSFYSAKVIEIDRKEVALILKEILASSGKEFDRITWKGYETPKAFTVHYEEKKPVQKK